MTSNWQWREADEIEARSYTCGHCDNKVASDRGYYAKHAPQGSIQAYVYICPLCKKPSYFTQHVQMPGPRYGDAVESLPSEVAALYQEARDCMAASAYTAAMMACRKLLMNIAVARGAPEGKPFTDYVSYLASKHYVPPDGQGWVDIIRQKGNEANHEIRVMERNDAEQLLTFVGALLKFVFEFPSKVPQPTPQTTESPTTPRATPEVDPGP